MYLLHSSQVITTVVGTTYIFGFWATSDNGTPNGITLQATGMADLALNTIQVTSQGLYLSCSTTFVATATSTTISIIGWDVPGFLDVDDISVLACA